MLCCGDEMNREDWSRRCHSIVNKSVFTLPTEKTIYRLKLRDWIVQDPDDTRIEKKRGRSTSNQHQPVRTAHRSRP